MPHLRLLKPELYGPRENGPRQNQADLAKLYGGRCDCGYVFFPYQSYGCEQCGATAEHLHPCELSGEGALAAAAPVHIHKGEGRAAPFVVGAVRLVEGPVVRTLLDYPVDAEPLAPGCPVAAVLLPVADAQGEPVLDLRFRPQSAGQV